MAAPTRFTRVTFSTDSGDDSFEISEPTCIPINSKQRVKADKISGVSSLDARKTMLSLTGDGRLECPSGSRSKSRVKFHSSANSTTKGGVNERACQTSRTPITQANASTPDLPVYSYYDSEYPLCTVHYIRNDSEADELAGALQGPLSFDMEWRVELRRNFPQRKTAVVQVADQHNVIVAHVYHMKRFPSRLRELIEDSKIPKVGANIMNDAKRLHDDYGILPRGVIELGSLALLADSTAKAHFGNRRIISLARMVARYCERTLSKGSERTSNWEVQQLSPLQVTYAANDVHSSLRVLQALLTNVSDPESARLIEECSQEHCGVFRGLLRQKSSPSFEGGLRQPSPPPGLILTPKMESAGMRPQYLRAYRYWHWKGLDVETLASQLTLKDDKQPLKFATVVSYVLNALQIEPSLPFDMGRLRLLVLSDLGSWPRHRDWLIRAWQEGRGRS